MLSKNPDGKRTWKISNYKEFMIRSEWCLRSPQWRFGLTSVIFERKMRNTIENGTDLTKIHATCYLLCLVCLCNSKIFLMICYLSKIWKYNPVAAAISFSLKKCVETETWIIGIIRKQAYFREIFPEARLWWNRCRTKFGQYFRF